jgi:hypothetical protein
MLLDEQHNLTTANIESANIESANIESGGLRVMPGVTGSSRGTAPSLTRLTDDDGCVEPKTEVRNSCPRS